MRRARSKQSQCGRSVKMERRAKTSFSISAESKHKLEVLRSDLRLEGFADVTEGALVEAMISDASLASLRKHLKKRR